MTWNYIKTAFFKLAHSVAEICTSHKFATVVSGQVAIVEYDIAMLLVSISQPYT
jgi:hypothetical protein